MVVLMYNLASTADLYLSPALEYVTIKFKMSESLAGVTLLAFGNGAPDVFSSIAASSGTQTQGTSETDLGNVTLATCGLMGSAFFISTVVIQAVLQAQTQTRPHRQVKVTPIFFTRDLVFYILAMIYLLGIMVLIHEIDVWVSLGFVLTYVIYVVLVFLQSKHVTAEGDKAKANEEAPGSYQLLGDEISKQQNMQTLRQADMLVNELSVMSKSQSKGGVAKINHEVGGAQLQAASAEGPTIDLQEGNALGLNDSGVQPMDVEDEKQAKQEEDNAGNNIFTYAIQADQIDSSSTDDKDGHSEAATCLETEICEDYVTQI